MAASVKAEGSQVAVVGNFHDLFTTTDAGTYVLVVDLGVLQAGDRVELRLLRKCRATGVERLAYQASFANSQSESIAVSWAIPCPHSFTAQLIQASGTARTFDWEVDVL